MRLYGPPLHSLPFIVSTPPGSVFLSFCFTFSVSLDFSVSLSSLSISVELTSSHLHREAVVHTALLPFVEDHLCAGPWAAILKLDPFLLGREVSQCSRVADTVWN